ncbi:transmembrane protein 176B-like [Brienomyrus brachyistius]|uniref:transmembrane protein 176B-like n=1 Tax=Brienomyrus brachyistius TaxID=42636 RepID=UPI0020B4567C|nr:transmembrane protein 176B-like [Brienomyrus brachyistius]
MPVSVTKGDGVTVLTMKSDTKSNCPLIFQLLAALCCSPACAVSQGLKRLLGGAQSALGTVQIMLGLFNIGLGAIVITGSAFYYGPLLSTKAPFWIGAIFIVAGIMCILTERFPSQCLVFLNTCMSCGCGAIALTAIVLYSIDLANGAGVPWACRQNDYNNNNYGYGYGYGYRTTIAPEVAHMRDINRRRIFELCNEKRHMLLMMLGGIDIVLLVCAVLQLCINISVIVVNLKALCQKHKEDKEDPKLLKPLLDEVAVIPTV